MKTKFKKTILSLLPKSELGDRVYAFLTFLYFHHRLPNNSSNFIDVLHRVKTTGLLKDPVRVFVSDKYLVKQFVAGTVGEKYNVPTIALLDNENSVNKFVAPKDCIVKPCHSSGDVIFLKEGQTLDFELVKPWLSDNYYELVREANYKNLKKRIIVEPILYGSKNLRDYKFFFNSGAFVFLQVDVDRLTSHKRAFYNKNFEPMGFSTKYPLSEPQDKPENYSNMLSVATKLAANFEGLIRIDLYSNGNDIKLGEITNCHGSAREGVLPKGKKVMLDDYL